MHRIDDKNVVLGGLAAGVVLLAGNVLIGRFAGTELATAAAVGTDRGAMNPAELWGYAWAHLLIGVVVSWIRAALSPSYGTGARAAVRAGLAVWVIAMPAPMAFETVLHLAHPGLEGGVMLGAMAISAGLYAAAGLAAAGAAPMLAGSRRPSPEPATERS